MKKYDVIVCGGGFAGVCAAISAARDGAKVLIIDKGNCFGGAACYSLVHPYMKYWTDMPETNEIKILSGGIFSEINKNMLSVLGMKENNIVTTFYDEYLKLVLNRMVIKEGIDILFNTYIDECEVCDGKIVSVSVANVSGREKIGAGVFIDCTGDANIAAMSGCPYRLGREGDNLCQPMTLCFRVGNVDLKQFAEDKKHINDLYNQYQREGKIKNLRENVLTFKTLIDGVVHFNSTRVVKRNPTDARDVTEAEIEAREQVFELFDFLKANFKSFENASVISTASQIGARESRMIEGKYVLTQEDLINLTRFEDSIAVGNYDIDIHNPEGTGTSHRYFKPGEYYTIPYRCLIPKKIDNLLVSGRCISSTHEAQASYRIMPICACLGQAAGTAAALAAKNFGCSVNDVDVKLLQDKLVKAGAVIS